MLVIISINIKGRISECLLFVLCKVSLVDEGLVELTLRCCIFKVYLT